jgi:phosphoglycolate phosphatase-like HAD superfamily hydrolase
VRLFLFDVDGTLLTARGAGRQAVERALRAVYGTAGAVEGYDFRGKTDPQIVFDLIGPTGRSDAAIRARLGAFFETYVSELEALLADGARVQVLPGVAELVQTLAARDDAVVGLLTGNIERGARVKLWRTGLWPLFRVGAYGSDDPDRRRLPAIACARARTLLGREFPFDRVTILGDTPLDIACARACGARAVAVATGHHAAEDLAACQPDLMFPDFVDVAGVLRALTRG